MHLVALRSRVLFCVPLILLFSGCVAVSNFKGVTLDDDKILISGLPPILQDKQYTCGAACLVSVASYWGADVSRFKSQYPTIARGTTGPELQQLAETLGLAAYTYEGGLEDIEANLRQGRPVIVMIPRPMNPILNRMGFSSSPVIRLYNRILPKPAHWVVVFGYTKDKEVIVYDPANGPLAIKLKKFNQWWEKMNKTCVLVTAR